MSKNFKVRSEFSITRQRVIDLFISACEGGSNYWCAELTPKGNGDAYMSMLAGFTVVESETAKKTVVTSKDIQGGLELMAKKYPRHFFDFLQENEDAVTADVFLQLCVFKDLIYG